MIIDFHIHMGPPQPPADPNAPAPAAPKMAAPPEANAIADKSPEGIKKHLRGLGIEHVVVQHMSIRPGGTKHINDFAKELAKDKDGFFSNFGGFHPDDDPNDLKDLKESGCFSGVKLHPYLQKFTIDDPKMYPAYEMLSSLGLPVLFHTGGDPFDKTLQNAFPEKIVKIHNDFPKLQIVAAHLGALGMYDRAEELIIGTDMFIDLAATVVFCKDLEQYKRILTTHDPEKIFFGSDFMMGSPTDELEFLNRLNLSSDLMDNILYKNAQKFLGLK